MGCGAFQHVRESWVFRNFWKWESLARGVRYLGAVACALVLLGVTVSSAWAAFPGRDGLLAVAPVSGSGVVLVDSHGRQERRICRGESYCRSARRPRWSADGRALAVTSPGQPAADVTATVSLIYPDGSCLNCEAVSPCAVCSTVGAPGFLPAAGLLTVVSDGALLEYGVDGLERATVLNRGVSDAVWSSRGALAVVQAGRVSIGKPGRLRSIGVGADPSWSPGGTRLVISRGGWLTVISQEGHSVRRLVRGGAPAWSPDGGSIAFIGPDHRLSVVSVAGDRVRRVGNVRGVSVDWQPVPRHARAGCVVAPGSVVVTESGGTSVTLDTRPEFVGEIASQAYVGCLRADRRERWLATVNPYGEDEQGVTSFVVNGDYVGWVDFFVSHWGGSRSEVHVFDLRTGLEPRRLGGETATCGFDTGSSCGSAMDDLVLGANGFSAAHTTLQGEGYPQIEKIVASDSRGITTLDAVTSQCNCEPTPLLTGLNLTGDTLTWSHDGTPETAQLQ